MDKQKTTQNRQVELKLKNGNELFSVNSDNPLNPDYRRQCGIEELIGQLKKSFWMPGRLIIRLAQEEQESKRLVEAIKTYCRDKLAALKKARWKRGVEISKTLPQALLILTGLIFLSHLVDKNRIFGDFFSGVISEGLFIISWVSLWHPIEMMLYDNWFSRHDSYIYKHILSMEIRIEPAVNPAEE